MRSGVPLVTAKTHRAAARAGTVMPLKLRFTAPAAKAFGVVTVQVPVTAPPAALILVSISVNEAFVCGLAPVFVKVSVTVEEPLTLIEVGENDLEMVGASVDKAAQASPKTADLRKGN